MNSNSKKSATTPWQRLKNKEISLDNALNLLVDSEENLYLDDVDSGLSDLFFRQVENYTAALHVVPLLLWQCRYYLGCPVDMSAEDIKQLSNHCKLDVEIIHITEKSYIDWYYRQNKNTKGIDANQRTNPINGEPLYDDIAATTEAILFGVSDQIDRINTFLADALRNRASDIHFEPSPSGLKVRYRIDGMLIKAAVLPVELNNTLISAIKVMSDMDPANRRIPQDGRMSHHYVQANEQKNGLDIRVNTLPCEGGESAVLRLLPKKTSFSQIDDVGFSQKTGEIYKSWLQQPQGMIIFTGPTGSGKTSTLYASLLHRAKEDVKVITVENPVEYLLPGIVQTHVNVKAGMTFAKGLEAILRQDPDIIMLGEIRNHETAETAIQAAMTGHLVLTTLHTNDAVGAIRRLRDLGVDTGSISDALLGVVAQRLVRRVCPHCAEHYIPTDAELEIFGLTRNQLNLEGCRKGRGCPKCYHTGYFGREAIVELLNVDPTIQDLIYEGTMHQLQNYLREINYDSFRLAAIEKLVLGITTVEEIGRVLHRNALYQRGREFPRNHLHAA